jgi:hypothetical protein
MAKKELDFVIKVNNQQIDLSKKSFKEFDTIIKQAKKTLQELPLSDPRYKVLNSEIKAAETAWKATTKAAANFNDEMDNGDDKVKTFKAQIMDATKELFNIEKQFGKTSQQYVDQQNKIKALRDEQEEFTRGTMKLDDALGNLPGPIGQVGQAMQATEVVTQSAKSAFNSLIQTFPLLKNAWVATGFGAIIVVIGILIAAVMDAAKSFKPLQNAFAALKDSVGAIFNALKPVTDFLLNVFVGVLKVVAGAINLVASAFGGMNNGAAQASLELERSIKKQESLLNNYGQALDNKLKEYISAYKEFNEKKKKILDDDYQNEVDRTGDLKILQLGYINFLKQNLGEREKLVSQFQTDVRKTDSEVQVKRTDNQRQADRLLTQLQKQHIGETTRNELNYQKVRMQALKDDEAVLRTINTENAKEALNANITSQKLLKIEMTKIETKGFQDFVAIQEDQDKKNREYARKDVAVQKERYLQIIELNTSLIKEDNARNLQAAKDNLLKLKEDHRLELEEAKLQGISLKNLKEKQAAEDKLGKEQVRKAQVQVEAYNFQLKINDEQRNFREELSKSTEFYQRKRDLVQVEFQKDYALADGNKDLIEEARTKEWEAILAIDKEELGNISSNLELEYSSMYQLTSMAFNKLRDIENARFEESKRGNEQNYEYIEALTKQHQKNLIDIDNQESQYRLDLEQRNADTRQMLFQGFFKEQRRVEQEKYDLDVKMAGDNIALKETLEKEHQRRMREMKLAEVDAYLGYYSQLSSAVLGFYAQQDKINSLTQQNELDKLQNNFNKQQEYNAKTLGSKEEFDKQTVLNERELALQQDKVKEEYFYKNRDAQYAQAMISAFQAAISAYSSLAAIPVVGPALGAAAAAVALGFGIKQANLIKQQTYVSSVKAEFPADKAGKPSYGRNYGDGGMIEGPLHAGGGVMINAEGGEAVISRGAVSMFGPMLSMMNQMGGGTSFSKGAMGQANFDNPMSGTSNTSQPQIIKTYVVSNELTSEVQKQARLKSLSTL